MRADTLETNTPQCRFNALSTSVQLAVTIFPTWYLTSYSITRPRTATGYPTLRDQQDKHDDGA
jgi:hypothetical protein